MAEILPVLPGRLGHLTSVWVTDKRKGDSGPKTAAEKPRGNCSLPTWATRNPPVEK